MEFDIKKHTILKVVHGSRAYGTNIETSDVDVKGVAIAPLEYYIGFAQSFEQAEKAASKGSDEDSVIYDIRKFFKLAADTNPNILEILFVDEKDILYADKFGEKLLENKEEFLSKKAKHTFTGYAISQLRRIKTHRRWLLNPPKKQPAREDFGLPIDSKMSKSEIGAYEHVQSKGEKLPEHIMRLLQKEKEYANAKREWDQYQSWKNNRNKARAEFEAKFGFDAKHAMHLIRLLRMGKEILEGKGVIVKRPDKDFLLDIRNGKYSYEEIVEWADKDIAEIDKIYETSALPFSCNKKKLDKVCVDLIKDFHREF